MYLARRWRLVARRSRSFKACAKCKAINDRKANTCWNCGYNVFTTRWDGLIIIISEDSVLRDILGVDKIGYYAVKVL